MPWQCRQAKFTPYTDNVYIFAQRLNSEEVWGERAILLLYFPKQFIFDPKLMPSIQNKIPVNSQTFPCSKTVYLLLLESAPMPSRLFSASYIFSQREILLMMFFSSPHVFRVF